MHDLYWVDIGAQLIYIIQRPYKIISAILTVYLSYLAANMAKRLSDPDHLQDGGDAP